MAELENKDKEQAQQPQSAAEGQTSQAEGFLARNKHAALIGGGVVGGLILALVCMGICYAVFAGTTASQPQTGTLPQPGGITQGDGSEAAAEHEHNWVAVYGLEHHDAVTHEVEHPAEYADETSYHTVCNDCKQIIDGKADDHIAATEHSGYSTNVPIVNQVLASQGWTETVVDEEAHDELVITGEKCSICDLMRPAQTQDAQDTQETQEA